MAHQGPTSVDLSAIPPHRPQAREAGGSPAATPAEPADWRGEAERLRAALEDVVALAHANAEARHRVVQMQRRAAAALSGVDAVGRRG